MQVATGGIILHPFCGQAAGGTPAHPAGRSPARRLRLRAAGRGEQGKGVRDWLDVVHAENLHARTGQRQRRADCAGQAIGTEVGQHVTDELFPRVPDEHGLPQGVQFRRVAKQLEACSAVFEPDRGPARAIPRCPVTRRRAGGERPTSATTSP